MNKRIKVLCYRCKRIKNREECHNIYKSTYIIEEDGGKAHTGFEEVQVCDLCYKRMIDLGYGQD